MSDDDARRFREHCEWAASVVATWPAWKRNALRWYGQPNHSPGQSRQPVTQHTQENLQVTMPHLHNCQHSSYGICGECSPNVAPDDGWFPASIPPANCRRVVMRFDDDGSRDCDGFYWSPEGSWYKEHGSRARRNAVHPVKWKEIAKEEASK